MTFIHKWVLAIAAAVTIGAAAAGSAGAVPLGGLNQAAAAVQDAAATKAEPVYYYRRYRPYRVYRRHFYRRYYHRRYWRY